MSIPLYGHRSSFLSGKFLRVKWLNNMGEGGDREEEVEKVREVYCKKLDHRVAGAGKSKIHGMGQQAAAGRGVCCCSPESSIYRTGPESGSSGKISVPVLTQNPFFPRKQQCFALKAFN